MVTEEMRIEVIKILFENISTNDLCAIVECIAGSPKVSDYAKAIFIAAGASILDIAIDIDLDCPSQE